MSMKQQLEKLAFESEFMVGFINANFTEVTPTQAINKLITKTPISTIKRVDGEFTLATYTLEKSPPFEMDRIFETTDKGKRRFDLSIDEMFCMEWLVHNEDLGEVK